MAVFLILHFFCLTSFFHSLMQLRVNGELNINVYKQLKLEVIFCVTLN